MTVHTKIEVEWTVRNMIPGALMTDPWCIINNPRKRYFFKVVKTWKSQLKRLKAICWKQFILEYCFGNPFYLRSHPVSKSCYPVDKALSKKSLWGRILKVATVSCLRPAAIQWKYSSLWIRASYHSMRHNKFNRSENTF